MKKYIKLALVIVWMAVIFYFSNQTASVSDEKSRFVIQLFQLLGLDLNSVLGDMANFMVRKTAHFTEYMILFFLMFGFASEYEKCSLKKTIIVSIAVVFLYACTDELHQLFISGRAARFADVLIDSSGGCLGALISYFLAGRNASQ